MNEWTYEWTRSMCCLCILPRWLCDWSNTGYICGAGYDSTWPPSWTKTVIKAVHQDPSLVTHSWPWALTSSVFRSPFYLLWNPAEMNQYCWKWMQIRAQRDQIFPLGSGSWFVSLHLSPKVAFPCSEEENIVWAGVRLAGLLYSSLFSGYRSKGSSVRLDKMPVPPAIRGAWNTAVTAGHRPTSPGRAVRPPNQARRRAILTACQQSSKNVKCGFPKELLKQQKNANSVI